MTEDRTVRTQMLRGHEAAEGSKKLGNDRDRTLSQARGREDLEKGGWETEPGATEGTGRGVRAPTEDVHRRVSVPAGPRPS